MPFAPMATLNVKNVPDDLYERLRRRAKEQHRSVAQEVIHLVASVLDGEPQTSILELRGRGKASWRGVGAAQHVAMERGSWD